MALSKRHQRFLDSIPESHPLREDIAKAIEKLWKRWDEKSDSDPQQQYYTGTTSLKMAMEMWNKAREFKADGAVAKQDETEEFLPKIAKTG